MRVRALTGPCLRDVDSASRARAPRPLIVAAAAARHQPPAAPAVSLQILPHSRPWRIHPLTVPPSPIPTPTPVMTAGARVRGPGRAAAAAPPGCRLRGGAGGAARPHWVVPPYRPAPCPSLFALSSHLSLPSHQSKREHSQSWQAKKRVCMRRPQQITHHTRTRAPDKGPSAASLARPTPRDDRPSCTVSSLAPLEFPALRVVRVRLSTPQSRNLIADPIPMHDPTLMDPTSKRRLRVQPLRSGFTAV
jgi:hypothetical protein